MIPQKLEIIRSLESGEGQREVMASYNIRTSTIYDIKKVEGPIMTVYGIK